MEIKFRFQLKLKTKSFGKYKKGDIDFFIIPLLGDENGLVRWPIEDKWEILSCDRYTGMKDSETDDIYENDICERNGHYYHIIFAKGAFGITGSTNRLDHLKNMHHGHALYNFTTLLRKVGTIYSHEELLKKKA